MPTVILKGPMRRYGLRGRVFDRGVPQPVTGELRDLLMATKRFVETEDAPAKPARSKIVIKGKAAAPGREDWSGPGLKTSEGGEPAPDADAGGGKVDHGAAVAGLRSKALVAAYALEQFTVTLDADAHKLGVLRDQVVMLARGAPVEEVPGASWSGGDGEGVEV